MVIKLYTLDDLSFRCKYILLFVNKSCILIPELCEKGVVFHGKSISFPDDIFTCLMISERHFVNIHRTNEKCLCQTWLKTELVCARAMDSWGLF